MSGVRRFQTVAAALLVLFADSTHGRAATNTQVFLNGAVYTLNPKQPWASAVVITGGRIAYVGNDQGARAYVRRGAHVVALHGRMVLPGFHDAHAHPMSGGLMFLQCRLGAVKTPAQFTSALRSCDAHDSEGKWLIGRGWSPRIMPASLAALDALVPNKPAFLATEDGFAAWANSAAFAAAGIDPKASALKGMARDPRTHLATGMVTDEALERIRSVRPRPSEAQYRKAFALWSAQANRLGIVSVFDAAATPPMIEAYHAADQAGDLTLRVVAAQLVDADRGPGQVDDMVALRNRVRGPLFRADAAKIFVDGEIDQHSAALLAPYADRPGFRGHMLVEPPALGSLVTRLDRDGFLIHMHVMGDRSLRSALDAYQRAFDANGPRERRDQIAHVALADSADLARFARLNITANLQPMWFQADDPAMAATKVGLGPARSNLLYPAASIAVAGGRIVMSSDWPSTSLNPLDGIQVAVTRQPLGGGKPAENPRERIKLADALAAYTRNPAWVVREDKIDGTLEVGKAADLIILDRDLFTTPTKDIHKARVLLTLLAGKAVSRDSGFH